MLKSTIWDFWADKYDRLWVQKYSLGPSRREIIKAIAPILSTGRSYRLLDMGCGTGQMIGELQAAFREFDIEYSGVDISSKMIEKCREKDIKSPYFVSDICDFAETYEAYDFIICSHSYPYYGDKPGALRKLNDLLKKDGRLFLVQASANSVYDRIIMCFVKFTTSKAQYPSVKDILRLTSGIFSPDAIIRIKERFFMPTICLFVLKKEGDQ